jgi:RecB family endonuclease NucS
MTAIWHHDGTGWALLPWVDSPDEATLHTLIAEAPQRLPLSGSPSLVVVGREVQVGSGWADLIALEPSGQVAIIEIKLARHAEARRAVGQTAASAPILSP